MERCEWCERPLNGPHDAECDRWWPASIGQIPEAYRFAEEISTPAVGGQECAEPEPNVRPIGLRVKSFGENIARCKYRSWKTGDRRWLKRQSAKKVRRIGKADPEFAPTKLRYAGWAD